MKALSIRQPWAWLIVNGYKDIENRTWKTNFRGKIYVHAGLKIDKHMIAWLNRERPDIKLPSVNEFIRGAIVGEVDIIDCVTSHNSWFFEGPYGFVLDNPREYKRAVTEKGKLGFFTPEQEKMLVKLYGNNQTI